MTQVKDAGFNWGQLIRAGFTVEWIVPVAWTFVGIKGDKLAAAAAGTSPIGDGAAHCAAWGRTRRRSADVRDAVPAVCVSIRVVRLYKYQLSQCVWTQGTKKLLKYLLI